MKSDVDSLLSECEQFLQLHLDDPNELASFQAFGMELLRKLDKSVQSIRALANGYPENPISGQVWMDGASLVQALSALTGRFKDLHWLQHEDIASSLWAKATLSIMSHYRNRVGPAMLANADCNERSGNTERALALYDAVISDFASLVEDWENDSEVPIAEDLEALKCLRTALERSMLLSPELPGFSGWMHLHQGVESILRRS